MPRRLPITLWLYILADMWRLLLLTTGVLVTVIAFAAAVKPLADGKLGPLDCIRFMLFAMPPMLQYALPFSACFAATLAYYRLASDNEIHAAHAGGISHRALLVPTMGTGLVLLVTLLTLSNFVIPRFLRSMADMISQDAALLLVKSIDNRQAVPMGDSLLYADKVVRLGPDADSGSYQRLWLGGVLLVGRGHDGNISSQGTAREAHVWLRRIAGDVEHDPCTQVVMYPVDFTGTGEGGRIEGAGGARVFNIPNAFSDDPKFLSFGDLARLRDEPDRMNWIDRQRLNLAAAVAQRQAFEALKQSLQTTGRAEFTNPVGDRFTLYAADIRVNLNDKTWFRVIPLRQPAGGAAGPNPIFVDTIYADGRAQRRTANLAGLRFESAPAIGQSPLAPADPTPVGLSLSLRLLKVAAQNLPDPDEDFRPLETASTPDAPAPPAVSGEIEEWKLTGLIPSDDELSTLVKIPARPLLDEARKRMDSRPADRASLTLDYDKLSRFIASLMREITSKIHERLAMAAACLVMLLTGAIMAMRLRESLPLTIYLWAFFPALGTVITISAGQQLTHQQGAIGLFLLWGGVAALGAYASREFLVLARH